MSNIPQSSANENGTWLQIKISFYPSLTHFLSLSLFLSSMKQIDSEGFFSYEIKSSKNCKHLHFFDHLSNHFELTQKIWKKLTWKLTNYQDMEISELEIFCFSKNFEFLRNVHEILWKIWNFATKTKQIFFLSRIKLFWLLKEIFTFLYCIVDLPTWKFCRYLKNCQLGKF